jgi:hypothetical protein
MTLQRPKKKDRYQADRAADRKGRRNITSRQDGPAGQRQEHAQYLSREITRLCKLLHEHGLGLEPGQPVITGAFCHQAVSGPSAYRAVFSGIGEVALKFI